MIDQMAQSVVTVLTARVWNQTAITRSDFQLYINVGFTVSFPLWILILLKCIQGIVHFKMKISCWFSPKSHPRCIWLSSFKDKYNRSYFNKHPDASELEAHKSAYQLEAHKSATIHHKSASHGSGGLM